jgi:hypothetical protein
MKAAKSLLVHNKFNLVTLAQLRAQQWARVSLAVYQLKHASQPPQSKTAIFFAQMSAI